MRNDTHTEKENKCEHKVDFYYPSINEAGWLCIKCKESFRSLKLDKENIYQKVRGLLDDLHNSDFIHVSNGTMGDCITENVVSICKRNDRYDQLFIIKSIFEDGNIDVLGHSNYWRKHK